MGYLVIPPIGIVTPNREVNSRFGQNAELVTVLRHIGSNVERCLYIRSDPHCKYLI